MKLERMEESLRRLGMTDEQIDETFPLTESADEVEVDPSDNRAEEDPDGEGYLSPGLEEEDDDDLDSDDGINYDAFVEGLDDDDLDEIAVDNGLEEGFIKLATAGVRKARRKKMKKWLKSSEGRKYASKKKKAAKTSIAKMKRKKHAKKLRSRGGSKKGRMFRESTDTGYSSLMEDVAELAHALDHDPEDRFGEFATAFNHVADLGELAAMNVMDEDADAAKELLALTAGADDVLRRMEKMGGTVTKDQDAMLEATLADAMNCVGETMSTHGILEDEGDDDEDVLSESFFGASEILKESSANFDEDLSVWDSSTLVVEDSMLDQVRRLRDGNR